MGRIVEKTLSYTDNAAGTATGWVSLNTNQENFHIGFAIKKSDSGDTGILHVDGTLQDILVSGTVASADYFSLISAVSTSASGTNVAGEITFPVAGVRLRNVTAGSGAVRLNFKVIQTGKI
jgi:hypothetical protein